MSNPLNSRMTATTIRTARAGWLATMLAIPLSLMAVAALAEESNTCSAAYFAALGDLRAARGDALAGAVAAMRAPDAMLPGQWLYAGSLFGRTFRRSRPVLADRPCLEMAKVFGRLRCIRYGTPVTPAEPPLPTDLDITPQPSAEEMRIFKAVADLVDTRGAIPDVGPNGRQTWLATRATADLKSYVTQPMHVALCSGAKEVTEFYANALRPLQKRTDDVAAMSQRAHVLAAERTAAAIAAASTPPPAPTAAAPLPAPAAASAPASSDAAATPATPAAQPIAAQASPPAPPPAPSPPPSAADIAKLPLVAMVAEAVRGVLTPDDAAAIRAETYPLSALRRAKPMLILAQVAAKTAADSARADRVLAAGRAVRMIEAAAYADVYAERYARFAASVITLPAAIQSAHAKTCTCGP